MIDLALEDDESLNAGLGDTQDSPGSDGPTGEVSDPVNPEASTVPDDVSLHLQELENSPMSDDQMQKRLAALDSTEEITLISNADAALEDLAYLREDILKAQGMCKSFAMEAQRIDPDFDNKSPIGFYTQRVSATRYRVSLESIGESIWNFIKKIWQWISKICSKILRFFVKSKDVELNEDATNISEVEHAAKEELGEQKKRFLEKREDIEAFLKYITNAEDEYRQPGKYFIFNRQNEPIPFKSLNETIEFIMDHTEGYSEFKQFLETKDPFLNDILVKGPYSKAIMELVKDIPAYTRQVKQQINVVTSMLKSLIDAQEDRDNIDDVLKLKEHELKQMGYTGDESENPILSLSDKISQLRLETQQQDVERKHHYTDLLKAYVDFFKGRLMDDLFGNLEQLIMITVEMEAKKKTLDKKIDNIPIANDETGLNERYMAFIKDTLVILKKHVLGIVLLTRTIERYRLDVERINDHVTRTSLRILQIVARYVRDEQGNHAYPDVTKVFSRLLNP